MNTTALQLLRLTQIVRSSLVDRAGETIGRVDDLIVRLGGGSYPALTGLQGRIGGRHVFIPLTQVAELSPGRIQLTGETVHPGRFERRAGEVLLRHDLFDRKLINVEAGRLVHAADIVLGQIDGTWRVIGIDTSSRNILKRIVHCPSHPSCSAADTRRRGLM